MTRITYIEFNGTERVLELEPGTSLMQGAVDNGVQGIIGDCGGNCSCATCHVYVDESWLGRLKDKAESEAMLLEEVFEVRNNSRLACQLTVTDELDGLVVQVPERQF